MLLGEAGEEERKTAMKRASRFLQPACSGRRGSDSRLSERSRGRGRVIASELFSLLLPRTAREKGG